MSSPDDLKSRIARFDVVVGSPQGLSGVTKEGPRPGGGVATDWDGDGHLDVVFSTEHTLNTELPVLEVGVDAYAGSLLEFHVLGYGTDGTQLVAYGGSSTTPNKNDVNGLGVPFNLRPEVRPPQVLMVLPPDGLKVAPGSIVAVTLVFSTTIDQTTAAAVSLTGPNGKVNVVQSWESSTINKGGPITEVRSILDLKVKDVLGDGDYQVGVDSALKSTAGLTGDAFASTFSVQTPTGQDAGVGLPPRQDAGIGLPPPGQDAGAGLPPPGQDAGAGLPPPGQDAGAAPPGCSQLCGGCDPSQRTCAFVCDPATGQCVDSCTVGGCDDLTQQCDRQTGLCS